MTSRKRNKPSKSGASALLSDSSQSQGDVSDVASIIAHIIIGVQPCLDISIVQLALEDLFKEAVDAEAAMRCGEEIAKKARTTLPTDGLGGVH